MMAVRAAFGAEPPDLSVVFLTYLLSISLRRCRTEEPASLGPGLGTVHSPLLLFL